MHFAAETKVYRVEPIRRVPADSRPLINCGPLPPPLVGKVSFLGKK